MALAEFAGQGGHMTLFDGGIIEYLLLLFRGKTA
jgi:hypothetical protein